MKQIYLFLNETQRGKYGIKNSSLIVKYRGICGTWTDPDDIAIGIEFASEPRIIYTIRSSAIKSIAFDADMPFVPFELDLLPELSQ